MKNADCWIFVEDSTAHETFLRFSELTDRRYDRLLFSRVHEQAVRVMYNRSFNTLWHPLLIMSYHNMVWESLLQTGSDRCPVYLLHTDTKAYLLKKNATFP